MNNVTNFLGDLIDAIVNFFKDLFDFLFGWLF
jgi:hypothetical protein